MPFCANCGNSLKEAGTLCDSCGTGAPQTSGVHPEYAMAGAESVASAPAISSTMSSGLSNNIFVLRCYLLAPLAGIVLLVMEPYKNDRFVRFHAFQSIFSCITWIAIWIVWGILSAVFETLFGGLIALITLPIGLILGFAGLAYWIFLMYRAYSSQTPRVPLISGLAEHHANN
jgi:uncharacterized membrane protein